MRRWRWGPLSDREKEANTREEYATAYDSLPPVLREFIRTSPVEMSARKVKAKLDANEGDVEKTLEGMKKWLQENLTISRGS